ncbi:MAG: hypothetical protein CMG15_02865 [Candidatus Marinimicrobia bacterium]|nr:hypothetical protein [Candidatus Neomarinimicrobiota bacterium]|tara:strand:- start:6353 stop:6925 length:573 start_codon:yes stop_codon:yes gene_type:complete
MVKKLYSTMNISIKTKLALFFNNLLYKSVEHSTLGLNDEATTISRILFVLPEEANYSRVVRIFLQSIYNAMGPNSSITIEYALSKNCLMDYDGLINNPLILFTDDDQNYWGLPNNQIINKYKGLDFHAVIDLNPEFNPFVTILISHLKSNIKIGYYSTYAEKYYNILIERKETDFLEKGNRYILQLLGLN